MSERIYEYNYARELANAWNNFLKVRGIGVMAKDKDEMVGKAYLAGFMSGIGSMNENKTMATLNSKSKD